MSTQPSQGSSKPARDQVRLDKSFEILTCTARNPQFSYAHLQVITDNSSSNANTPPDAAPVELGNLQVKTYCTAALRQVFGLTGAAVPLDILKVEGRECWVRVPRQDLGKFAAAVTAWRGSTSGEGGVLTMMRVKSCSDWLGSMVGSEGEQRIWGS